MVWQVDDDWQILAEMKTDVAGILWGWNFFYVGTMQGCFSNLALGASVEIIGELSSQMSYAFGKCCR